MSIFSKIKPLRNNVLFIFLDETAGQKGAFSETAKYGIIIPRTNNTQKVHRWVEVIAVGPEAEANGLKAGDYALIEGLMWMEGVKVDDQKAGAQKVWKTDDTKVLAVTNDLADCQSQAL